MQKYIIDGNNLIGKIRELQILQNKDKQAARERLAFFTDSYFHNKKIKVSLHFDGYQNTPIRINAAKIIYSENKTADEKIKAEISSSKNSRSITLITSDSNLREFARVCSCTVILSEEFAEELKKRSEQDDEERRIQSINDIEEFKRIFNVKK